MGQFHRSRTGDTVVVPKELDGKYQADPDWVSVSSADSEELKGAALDAALDQAGLPKTGSADEKRARLAEHQSGQEVTQ